MIRKRIEVHATQAGLCRMVDLMEDDALRAVARPDLRDEIRRDAAVLRAMARMHGGVAGLIEVRPLQESA